MNDKVYFAGGFYDDPANGNKEKVFEIVGPSSPGSVPYLTRSPHGLYMTAHHANIYRLSADGKEALLANHRCRSVSGSSIVRLSDEQIEAINRAIESNHFFDD